MKLKHLSTRIFLDSGNPLDTKKALSLLGFLDGQTTNPSLIAKTLGNVKLSKRELLDEYKKIVKQIASLIPEGSISIEVYADKTTSKDEMIEQAFEMYSWIPNAHIKLPVTKKGLQAASYLSKKGIRLNMTLVFTQQQAAAIACATQHTTAPSLKSLAPVFVSPFIGRLDDRGENGIDLVANISSLYKKNNIHHVMVLAASIRNLDHLLGCFAQKTAIVTVPLPILEQWNKNHMVIPDASYQYPVGSKRRIYQQTLNFSQQWQEFDISHPLTDSGLEKFANDWNNLIKR